MRLTTLVRALLIAGAFGTAVVRADTAFSQGLSPTERTAAGFSHLNDRQTAALNAMIQADIALARQGDVVGFSKTFTQRRTPEQRAAAGIDLMTPAERAKLDALVAAAMSAKPDVPYVTASAAKGQLQGVSFKRHAQVHGDMSVFYGQGSGGRNWYGGSFDVSVTDPSGRMTTTVGVSQVRGRGIWDCGGGPIW